MFMRVINKVKMRYARMQDPYTIALTEVAYHN
jgi:hypothetical protein